MRAGIGRIAVAPRSFGPGSASSSPTSSTVPLRITTGGGSWIDITGNGLASRPCRFQVSSFRRQSRSVGWLTSISRGWNRPCSSCRASSRRLSQGIRVVTNGSPSIRCRSAMSLIFTSPTSSRMLGLPISSSAPGRNLAAWALISRAAVSLSVTSA